MIKKFFAKLVGWQEQRSAASDFHQGEAIARENARHHQEINMQNERERLLKQREQKAPAQEEILGPSEGKEDK